MSEFLFRCIKLQQKNCGLRDVIVATMFATKNTFQNLKSQQGQSAIMYRISLIVIFAFATLAGCKTNEQRYAEQKVQSEALWKAKCDAGSGKDCYAYGLSYLLGFEGEEAVPKGLPLVKKGCDDGFMEACVVYGSFIKAGDLAPKDVSKGMEYIHMSCNGGYPKACEKLGEIYEDDEDVAQDKVKSTAFYTKACDLDSKQCRK